MSDDGAGAEPLPPEGLPAWAARFPAAVTAWRWFQTSALGHVWRRLDTIDFVSRGMTFAAVLLLSFVPFLLLLQGVRGRSGATDLIRRFGLDEAAAAAMREALTSPRPVSSTVSGLSWLFVVLGAVTGATAIQELYEQAFGVPSRGRRDGPRRLLWVGVLVLTAAATNALQPELYDLGGVGLFVVAALIGGTLFWWFSMWLLLGGRLGWIELLPAAMATGVCWLLMTIFFRLRMSHMVTSNYDQYGAIGVVFALMSFLIAVGSVIILGAVFGVVWRERRADPS